MTKAYTNFLMFYLQQSEKVKASGDLDDIKEQPPKFITHFQDGEENSDGDLSSSMMTTTETDCTISPTISHQHLALSRQTSKSSLLSMKLTLPNSGPGSPSSSSQRSLGYSCKSGSDSEGKHHHSAQLPTNPTYYVSYSHGHRELLDGRLCRPESKQWPLTSNLTTYYDYSKIVLG